MPKSLHERLIHSLEAQSCAKDLMYLIDALNKTHITSHATAAIFLFTVIYSHPQLLDDPEAKVLKKLCQDCFLHATPNQLHALLEKSENRKIKEQFDRFVEQIFREEEQRPENRIQMRSRK